MKKLSEETGVSKRLCPVRTLLEWVRRRNKFWEGKVDPEEMFLFTSINEKFVNLRSSTMSTLVKKEILEPTGQADKKSCKLRGTAASIVTQEHGGEKINILETMTLTR